MREVAWHSSLEPILRAAGDIVCSYRGKDLAAESKGDFGTVTAADRASETYLIHELGRILPEAGFLAEESGRHTKPSPYSWIIDPLDGTTNFSHGLAYFCISVALSYEGEPVCGAIYYPQEEQFFYAQQGKGAFCNGVPLQVSRVNDMAQALITTAIPYRRSERANGVEIAQKIAVRADAVRHSGAIALDLAHVAKGVFDGAIYTEASWWDIAAGIVLIQEAGGAISTLSGPLVEQLATSCVGGNQVIHDELIKLVK